MPLFDEISLGGSTVKIYTVENRGFPSLMLSYHWAGERKQRLFRYASGADEKKVRKIAKDIATAMYNGRGDLLTFNEKDKSVLRAARDALSKLGMEVDAACREYANAREVIGDTGTVLDAANYFRQSRPSAVEQVQTSDAVEEYLVSLEQDRMSVRYIQDARHRLRRFAKDFRVPLAEIKTADMAQWLRGRNIAPRTRNNFRARITAFFHWAQDHGYLRKDVKTEADALKIVKAATTIHIFTPDQAGTLMEAAENMPTKTHRQTEERASCIRYLTLGLFPGIRPQEILRMEASSIRFQHNDIEVLPAHAKVQRRRLIPIQPNVRAWLEAYPPTGKLVLQRTPKLVRALAKNASVPWHHDIMRHSAISYAVAATGNIDLVALWSGNSRDVIYESYLNQVTPAEAALYHSIMPKHAAKNVIRIASTA